MLFNFVYKSVINGINVTPPSLLFIEHWRQISNIFQCKYYIMDENKSVFFKKTITGDWLFYILHITGTLGLLIWMLYKDSTVLLLITKEPINDFGKFSLNFISIVNK